MQKAFYRHTFQRYELVAPNIFIDFQFNEMDIFGLRRSGYVDEVEIKLSRTDFLADFRKMVRVKSLYRCIYENGYTHSGYYYKPKHDALTEGLPHCNYFSFFMPKELVSECKLPNHAGLYTYYIDNAGTGKVRELKKAPRLHKRKISEHIKYEVGRKMAFRYWNKINE